MPESRKASPKGQIERRFLPATEARLVTDDGGKKIMGYAAVFNQLSEGLYGFKEKITPGAFAKTIQEADIRALWNHNSDKVLGRNKSGTLRLGENAHGLAIEINPPESAAGYVESIERGDVSQMSFGFRAVNESWEGDQDETTRTLLEVELFDVSPVTYPAYPQTDVAVRSNLKEVGIDPSMLSGIIFRAEKGLELSDTDHDIIQASIDVLSRYVRHEPGRTPLVPLSVLRKKLDLIELDV
ncbi:MAG: HK97 family phage prohead protease [Actinomycetota bacterium]